MYKASRIAVIGRECVACGCCAAACPKEAVRVANGVIARVEESLCIGCGKCAKVCPAAVIRIAQREEAV